MINIQHILEDYGVCIWLGFSLKIFADVSFIDISFWMIAAPTILLCEWAKRQK